MVQQPSLSGGRRPALPVNHPLSGASQRPGGDPSTVEASDIALVIGRIGEQIRVRRRQRGLSRAALARQAGVAETYLALVEDDRESLSVGVLQRIAQALQINVRLMPAQDTAPGRVLPLGQYLAGRTQR